MEKLSQEWFELRDIRQRHLSQQEWIPVYANENEEEGERTRLGYAGEFFLLRSVAVFNDKREKHKWNPMSWDRGLFNELNFRRCNGDGIYRSVESFLDEYEKEEVLGFNIIFRNADDTPLLSQEFILSYGLVQKDDIWHLCHRDEEGIPLLGEEIARQYKNRKRKIVRIEIKKDYLQDYLAARDAGLLLSYFACHEAIMKEKPDFIDSIKQYGALKTEKERMKSFKLYCRSTANFSWEDKNNLYTEGRLHRAEWLERADVSCLQYDTNAEEFQVWLRIDGVPRKRKLKFSYPRDSKVEYADFEKTKREATKFGDIEVIWVGKDDKVVWIGEDIEEILWFEGRLMQQLLYRGADIYWHERDAGRLLFNRAEVFFAVNEFGLINIPCWDIDKLPLDSKKFILHYNTRPQGKRPYSLPLKQDDRKYFIGYLAKPHDSPEVRLTLALKRYEAIFQEKFNISPLKKVITKDASLYKRLHRFRALDESSLQSLVVDTVKYCIERFHKDNLKWSVLKIDNTALDKKENLGSLKLLEKLIELCGKTEEAAKKMTCPLFGLYDLRVKGGGPHLSANERDIEDCYKRLGIDRTAPYIEQGAQMLENCAKAFEAIGAVLAQRVERG